jgi:hypothetical protein
VEMQPEPQVSMAEAAPTVVASTPEKAGFFQRLKRIFA